MIFLISVLSYKCCKHVPLLMQYFKKSMILFIHHAHHLLTHLHEYLSNFTANLIELCKNDTHVNSLKPELHHASSDAFSNSL